MQKQVVVIAGPSGSGKNSIINRLITRIPGSSRLVTATTRSPRPGETDGVDYFFFSMEKFDTEAGVGNIVGQRFVPLFGGTHYGIYLPELRKRLKKGGLIFAPVDLPGAEWLKEHQHALTIFITPESLDQYRIRIHSRSPEMSPKEFDTRMDITDDEMRVHAQHYDYRVINADGMLEATVSEIVSILAKEGYIKHS